MKLKVAARSARELVRHAMVKAGIASSGGASQTGTIAERFTDIYERAHWREGREDLPLSGAGSTLAATEALRRELPAMLARLGARQLLDVGCGDFFWMRTLELPCDYIGVDIVPSVIAANQAAFGGERRSFMVVDAVARPLPAADVVLCREVLFHLNFQQGGAVLQSMLATGCAHLLLTTDQATGFNSDIVSGGMRLLNLEIAPFRLGPPEHVISEDSSYPGRRIGVWSRARVESAMRGYRPA